ncbi:MAG: IreB family regulatory phosphoprotein [Clostridia bacterium]|nr:IreB family regulatory phosphoprotein [Clostridia bacterium]MDD4048459.1 IreB family regulatory phosphoprotein [Clostridia bacterium]
MNDDKFDQTMMFKVKTEEDISVREVLQNVYDALKEKGYNPINQIVGYLLSADPAYITSHNNARALIKKLERDEVLEELVSTYLRETK